MKVNKQKGITLVELIVTTGLVVILTLVVTVLLVRSISAYRYNQKSVSLQEDAAKVMREFEYSARAATEVTVANVDELVYLRFFDLTSPSPTQVRFYVYGTQLKMGKTEPAGVEPNITYPSENEIVTMLVDNLQNTTTVFNYFDELNNQLASPINVPAIKMTEIIVTLDDDPDNTPAAITERTMVQFRNLKTNF